MISWSVGRGSVVVVGWSGVLRKPGQVEVDSPLTGSCFRAF